MPHDPSTAGRVGWVGLVGRVPGCGDQVCGYNNNVTRCSFTGKCGCICE